MATLTLTEEETQLTTAALEGLAQQLATRARAMAHGPAQVATCDAVGKLRRIARRLESTTTPPR